MEQSISVLHSCIYIRLCSKCKPFRRELNKDIVMRMLGEVYHVPKEMRGLVLKEMEELGFIKKDKKVIEVLKVSI